MKFNLPKNINWLPTALPSLYILQFFSENAVALFFCEATEMFCR